MTKVAKDISNLIIPQSHAQIWLVLLICCHIAVSCWSLVFVADFYSYLQVVMFDKSRLYATALIILPVALASSIFIVCPFSFGYFLGFYFYTMILNYLWLVQFSKLNYNHTLGSISAFVSVLAFLVPALFVTSRIKQRFVLSTRAFDCLLAFIPILAALIIAVGAAYNFKLVGLADIYNFRNELEFPLPIRYAMGITLNALLPFAFSCFVARGNLWRAAVTLLLLLLIYPITLSKTALFAPIWLMLLAILVRFFEARISVVLSLFLPISTGVILAQLFKSEALTFQQMIVYFSAVNFRMIAFPAVSLDLYSDFFSTHDLTYFCQISFFKTFVHCPYNQYLSLVMNEAYHLGNANASLFATEGVASVGLLWAPVPVFVCGLVIALANRLSAGLPPRFILLSGAIVTQGLVNVPLTTALLTNGAAVLFLLWYIVPRRMFEQSRPNLDEPDSA